VASENGLYVVYDLEAQMDDAYLRAAVDTLLPTLYDALRAARYGGVSDVASGLLAMDVRVRKDPSLAERGSTS
jgi:hypothetical protein